MISVFKYIYFNLILLTNGVTPLRGLNKPKI